MLFTDFANNGRYHICHDSLILGNMLTMVYCISDKAQSSTVLPAYQPIFQPRLIEK